MPSTLQSKVAFRNPSFSLPFPVPSRLFFVSFSLVFLRNSLVFPTMQNISKYSLTLSTLHPSLSSPMKSALQKLLSFLAIAITYAALGYAFYFLFFASQL